jgi:AraC family transcriptional activator of tynA and feaB
MPAIRVDRYSTASAPPEGRLAYWNDVASRTFNNLVIDSEDRDGFRGDMVGAALGPLNLMSADCSRAQVRRANDPVRAARGPRNFDLHFQLSGRSINRQGGREAVLEAGDFTICDATQPYLVSFTEANHMLCVKVPADALAARLGDVGSLVCRPMSGRRGGPATLSAFLRTVWDQLDEPGDEDWAEGVSEVILDLIDLAYRPLQESTSAQPAQSLWRRKVEALIAERLCDPGLGARSIAEELGLSSRYVQMLFAEASTTPSAYILERRLKLAAERLRRAEGHCVTEVAMAVGFNDLTHFGRVFRKQYGVTPSEYRSGARVRRWSSAMDHRMGN